jgi:peptide/nickel transport system permease protein
MGANSSNTATGDRIFNCHWAIAIPMGIIAAVKQNHWIDRLLRLISYAGQGFPSFITALLLLILAQNTSPCFQ